MNTPEIIIMALLVVTAVGNWFVGYRTGKDRAYRELLDYAASLRGGQSTRVQPVREGHDLTSPLQGGSVLHRREGQEHPGVTGQLGLRAGEAAGHPDEMSTSVHQHPEVDLLEAVPDGVGVARAVGRVEARIDHAEGTLDRGIDRLHRAVEQVAEAERGDGRG